MKRSTDFAYYLSEFLTEHLAGTRNLSANTIKSYRDTYVLLLEYMEINLNKKVERIMIKDIKKDVIDGFLMWLEKDRNNSINTRNQRLAAIHALTRYLQGQKPEYMFECQRILSIPVKRYQKPVVDYLQVDEIKNLLSKPDTSNRNGRRDLLILSLLYDSGARVQELADLTIRDIRLDAPALAVLTGKGNKTRHVPLMNKTVELLKLYLQEQKLTGMDNLNHPLLYNHQRKKLTRQGIAYILKKYATECEIDKISPHIIRHTRAMHLTEADINPIYIRDFLGHTDLKVTEVYSKTSIKMKKKALEKMNSEMIPEKTDDWNNDDDLMDWLNSLGH